MTLDWEDLANVLRWILIAGGAGYLFLAWRRREDYRRAVLTLVALVLVDWLAHAFAAWVATADTSLPTEFSAFDLFAVAGALGGLVAARGFARRQGLSFTLLLDAALVVVLAGGVGARAYHVLTHWDYYGQYGEQVTNIAQGGMGLRGGMATGLLALAVFAALRRVSFFKLADVGALWLAFASVLGWYGAYLTGINSGAPSDLSFAQDLPDRYGIVAPRIPVQVLAVIFYALLFVLLLIFWFKLGPRPGLLLFLFLACFGAGNFALDFLRGDESLMWNGLTIDQSVDLAWLAVGLVGAAALARRPARRAAKEGSA